MTVVSMNYLLEAGVHFGHQRRRWNPKMKEYIYTSRDDIYIIDLQKTSKLIEEAYEALKQIVEQGGTVLFVGTKKQAQEAMQESAERTGMYYVTDYRSFDAAVEAEWSQAGFWYAARFLGNRVELRGLNEASAQGDRVVAALYERFKPAGEQSVDVSDCPDLLPPLAESCRIYSLIFPSLISYLRERIL